MLAPWKKRYDKPGQHIKEQRHYFATKVHLVKAMVFPVIMYRCESWVPKNWWFWIVVLETLQSPLDCKEIKPVHSKGNRIIHWKDRCWSWRCNTLATWCEELTHWKRPWCWERLKAKEGGWQRMRWLNSITDSMDMNLSKFQDIV